jgi:fatty acid desaturase
VTKALSGRPEHDFVSFVSFVSFVPFVSFVSFRTRWRRFLHGPYAPALTHGSLILVTLGLFALLLRAPFWLAFFPCAILQHRIGVLLHEYIHGIPFRRYRTNLQVLSAFDGVLLMFGLTELFRGTHLAHHRWLNTERDPAFQAARQNRQSGWGTISALEGVQHLIFLVQALRGRHAYLIPSRVGLGACLSLAWIAFWIVLGRSDVPLKLIALTAYTTLLPVSFRGAVEHHSHPNDPAFANEYRVVIPLFNLNKHVHHHRSPRRPWYLLEYQTERPLWTFHYFTHWFRVYVMRDYVLMRPVDPGAGVAASLRVPPNR